ncbi:MAG: ankyrin repeat domain-containing protein, partial [Synergistaceae bacterium]|nr:ankyrin repeat domain-containing protein [Synergistaceae bacterium]
MRKNFVRKNFIRKGAVLSCSVLVVFFLACSALSSEKMGALDFFELCTDGTPTEVEEALAGWADVNASDEHGLTPLMLAVSLNRPEIVEVLLRSGADVDATDEDGWTALLWSTTKSDVKVAEM